MPTVRDLLGASAVAFMRYGVNPDDDINRAVEILEAKAPHLARLLKAVLESSPTVA